MRETHREVFDRGMKVMDDAFGYPLLWGTPKLSSWYAVGLFERGSASDIERANKLLLNVCKCQYEREDGVAYGTFLSDCTALCADGTNVWPPRIYGSYDPNNALFVTIAGIVILSRYSQHVELTVKKRLREAMYRAVKGDMLRIGGEDGENLYPCYSNPWYMRCVCCAYVGAVENDTDMIQAADKFMAETLELFDKYGTLSEFNSPTYAGVTLLALALAQFLPDNFLMFKEAPRIMKEIWDQLAQTWNPTLTSISGPFDRTYGFDMTRYCALVAPVIAAATELQQCCLHGSDIASVPMQMITMEYMEKSITTEVKEKLRSLIPHTYEAEAFSPPFDLSPRKYSYWIEDGLSVGGVEYDHARIGGPNLNPVQWTPGVIMWNTGSGVGWLSHYVTSSTCSIVASSERLVIRYPPTKGSNPEQANVSQFYPADEGLEAQTTTEMRFKLGTIAGFTLRQEDLDSKAISLPGLDLRFSGNAADKVTLAYGQKLHDVFTYDIVFNFARREIPELIITWKKTAPYDDGFIR